jgi:lipoate-protein ligase A
MTLLDLTLPTAAENVALDEALLQAAEEGAGGEVLRVWEPAGYAVVVGAGGSVAIDVDRAACDADGVPVVRRASGGGTVLLGPGCLCVSAVLRIGPGTDSIPGTAAFVMGRLRDALAPVVPGVGIAGFGDLAVDGRKLAGSAQQRKRRHLLYHVSLLCGLDPGRVARYLRPPERQPDYRGGRDHAAFLATLPIGVSELRGRVVAAWGPAGAYPDPPVGRVRELVAEKYGRDEWNLRR